MDMMSALADPIRREILEILFKAPLSAGEIASRFPVSRPATSRHLRILREAGLVSVTTEGRERVYKFVPASLAEIDRWLARFRDPWESRLDALETEVFRTRRERERSETATTDVQMSTRDDDQKEESA